jgi:phosphatidylinositol glycan class B
MQLKKIINYIVIISITVFAITALNSNGFYHADEHYQVLEFAIYKDGINEAKDLAWEFKEKMRSGILPTFAYVFFGLLKTIGIVEPHMQNTLLRLLVAILALFTLFKSTKYIEKNLNITGEKWLLFCALTFLTWFIPFLSVRYTAETLSGLLLLWIILESNQSKIIWYRIGVLTGLAFIIRFQILFFLVPYLFFILLKNKVIAKNILLLLSSFAIVFCLGVLIDSWFYSELTFTSINYLKIVLDGIFDEGENAFGNADKWFYFIELIKAPLYPIGLLYVISVLILWYKEKLNPIVISLLIYILIHTLIDHKEVRFLFPLAYLMPIIVITAVQKSNLFNWILLKNKIISICIWSIILIVNLIGLSAMMFKSAGIGRMELTKYIADNYGDKKITIHHTNWANPYDPWQGLKMNFYYRENMTFKLLNDPCNPDSINFNFENANVLICRKTDLDNNCLIEYLNNNQFKFKQASIPDWIVNLNEYYNGFESKDVLQLYIKQ